MSLDLARRRAVAEDIIRAAGRLAAAHFENRTALTIDRKSAQDLVSAADRESEALIVAGLAEAFPQDGILGEEGSARALEAEAVWIVDPIDGTRNFLTGVPMWCVSIGLVVGGRSVLGVVFHPMTGELFIAEDGKGATCNGKPIRVTGETEIGQARIGLSFSPRDDGVRHGAELGRLLAAGSEYARLGSGVLGLTYVAAGRLDAFFGRTFYAWDAAAGLCLVREAGGVTNDFFNADAFKRGNAIFAATPALADAFREIVDFHD